VPPEGAEPCGRRILERVTAAVPDVQVAVGVSDPRSSLGDLEGAHREALMAMTLAERHGWPVLRFADVGLYRLLFDVEHIDRVDEHVERWLGPLLRYDAAHHTQFVKTLTTYLTGSGHQEAARALSIHPSTIKYRMRRIREILGFDFTQGEARFNVELAVRLDEARQRIRDGRNGGPQANRSPSQGSPRYTK
jgi:DNA-binding PucR family transcriptional regulator